MDKYIQEVINRENNHLTTKKEHTGHKIRYVTEYVRQWLLVACNKDNDNINFIDCMCNAGVYTDGDYCTAIEVVKIFCEMASNYPSKNFNVLFNDLDSDKIRIAKEICDTIYTLPKNVNVFFANEDVNVYISTIKQKYKLFAYPSMTILYVDPFDFRTVSIPNLKNFISNKDTYCEVIFNLFTSDFVRNGVDDGISKSLGGQFKFESKDDLWEYIAKELTVGKMKYCLSYPFRNINNTELYQIMFITPHSAGLDKLKHAIWNTFNGAQYYRTINVPTNQLSFLDSNNDKEMMANQYALEAITLLRKNFQGKIISYSLLSDTVLFKSLLMDSQLIKYLIKPYIEKGILIKQNLVVKNNYKQDSYKVM